MGTALVMVTGTIMVIALLVAWEVREAARQERRRQHLAIIRRLERVTRPVDAPRPRIVAPTDREVA